MADDFAALWEAAERRAVPSMPSMFRRVEVPAETMLRLRDHMRQLERENEEWKAAARGNACERFGPRTPAEWRIFEEERARLEHEIHEKLERDAAVGRCFAEVSAEDIVAVLDLLRIGPQYQIEADLRIDNALQRVAELRRKKGAHG